MATLIRSRSDAAGDSASHASRQSWRCGRFAFELSRPIVMGIVNVTPDSFSDGGSFVDAEAARAHARRLVADGADLIDVGGESTRPGSVPVSADDELQRVLPVVRALCEAGIAVSIDTSKPEVMRAALACGAAVVNDVYALRAPGAVEVVAPADCGVVLMHMQGTPQTMQDDPRYGDVTAEVAAFLGERCRRVQDSGVAASRIAIDPGFGFGKTHAHNYQLLARLGEIAALDFPLLVGISRKGMLKHATGRGIGERAVASAAAALIAVQNGAHIVRVHDVAATRDALAVWQKTREHRREQT